MPDINIKSFNQLVEILEKMADGVKRHQQEADFPAAIKEDYLRTSKNQLEDLRGAYEEAVGRAKRLQNEYRETEAQLREELARYKSMIYGFYGKKNSIVTDFGIRPFKERTLKKKEK